MASVTTTESNGTALHVPRLARETEPCAHCGALLASDQRYCLSCGERRADMRVPFPVAPPVVAAGRAIVEKLAPGKSAHFSTFPIGDPAGAELSASAPPTVVRTP